MDVGGEGPVGSSSGHGEAATLSAEVVQGFQVPFRHPVVGVIERIVEITDQQQTVKFSHGGLPFRPIGALMGAP